MDGIQQASQPMAANTIEAPKQITLVDKELNSLTNELVRLEQNTANLIKRLGPVLRSESVGTEPDEKESENLPLLANRIKTLRQRLNQIGTIIALTTES